MEIKKILDWKHILLDTSFIIDYLSDPERYLKNPVKKQNIEIAKSIMKRLSSSKKRGKPYFYVTAITLGELQRFESKTVFKTILEVFSAGDVNIVSYGKNEALEVSAFISGYGGYKHAKGPRLFIRDMEKARKESGCLNHRGWVSDDMKILGCAKRLYDRNLLDVILTSDEKTFFPIAEFWRLPCRVLNAKHFPPDIFGDDIMEKYI
jgi:hypothetical protein